MEVRFTSQPIAPPRGQPARPPTSASAEERPEDQVTLSPQAEEARAAAESTQPASPTAQAQEDVKTPSDEEMAESLQELVEEINDRLVTHTNQAQVVFQVDAGSGDVVIQVVDKESDEVIRQIPPEEVVALRERMAEMRGLLFDREG